jgi:LmbE family N-acetylglucosaminyl deacetylase
MKRILLVAAHPDDEVLGGGGMTLIETSRGNSCHILILTDGITGRYDEKTAAVHRESIQAANKILGTEDVILERFPNQAMDTVPVTHIAQCIEAHMERIRPTVVYTHNGGDLNRDHQIAYEATIIACRPYPGQEVREVYTYYVPSSTDWHLTEGKGPFIPNVFVNIKDFIDRKTHALQAYKTECRPYPHPRSPESLRVHANYWGLIVGLEYAEPFRLIRSIR